MKNNKNVSEPIKQCQSCGKIWNTLEEIISQKDLIPLGFQAHFSDGNKSVLLFHHDQAGCNTTIAIPVIKFAPLIPGYFDLEVKVNSEGCMGHCLTDGKLEPCSNTACRNALVRDFVQKLLKK